MILVAAAGVAGSGDGGELSELDSGEAETDECPVCGEENCERLFHVHLSGPFG